MNYNYFMEASQSNEAKLIGYAIEGNVDAFNRLVLAYQTTVFNTALRIMNDPAKADDIAQTAFISAWQHMDSFKGSSFKPWIIRITINACYDELRRLRRRGDVPLEIVTAEDEEIEDAKWMIDQNPTPIEQSEQKELMGKVQNCLKAMTEEFRVILTLIDIDEISYQDAADIIKKPLGTVKSRLLRARLRMRECISSKDETFSEEKTS